MDREWRRNGLRATIGARLGLALLISVLPWAMSAQEAPAQAAAGMKPLDRERLLAHFAMSEDALKSETAGLSEKQLAFRPGDDKWSIAEVLEHLAVAEPQYWKQVQDSLNEPPPDPARMPTDAQILWYGIDRTQRNRTGAAREPHGQFGDPAKSLKSFLGLRAEMKAFLASTDNDLRAHTLQQSTMSVYQWALMISSHSQRHLLQIREIKAAEGFPRR